MVRPSCGIPSCEILSCGKISCIIHAGKGAFVIASRHAGDDMRRSYRRGRVCRPVANEAKTTHIWRRWTKEGEVENGTKVRKSPSGADGARKMSLKRLKVLRTLVKFCRQLFSQATKQGVLS